MLQMYALSSLVKEGVLPSKSLVLLRMKASQACPAVLVWIVTGVALL